MPLLLCSPQIRTHAHILAHLPTCSHTCSFTHLGIDGNRWSIIGDAGRQTLRRQFDFLISTHSANATVAERPFQIQEKYVDAVGHARKMPYVHMRPSRLQSPLPSRPSRICLPSVPSGNLCYSQSTRQRIGGYLYTELLTLVLSLFKRLDDVFVLLSAAHLRTCATYSLFFLVLSYVHLTLCAPHSQVPGVLAQQEPLRIAG